MKPQERERWQGVRAQGARRFILRTGVLAYGMPMFVAMTFFVNEPPSGAAGIAISLLIWCLGGAAFGAIMWHLTERRYRKAERSQGGSEQA